MRRRCWAFIPLFFCLLAACSQTITDEASPRDTTEEPTASAAVPASGSYPARIRWAGGNLTLKGCAWQGEDKDRRFRALYLERSRAGGFLTLYDGGNNRYLRLPKGGGQAHWRKGTSGPWRPFRRVEPFSLPPQKVDYQPFIDSETSRDLLLCPGKHIALLLSPRPARDLLATAQVVPATDRAYSVYRAFTGREPIPFRAALGRASIAEMPDGETCGAGCGYLGLTGIEIASTWVDLLLDQVWTKNEYDQVVFYELGRNFWFYGDQLGTIDPFVTGFAIVGRFVSMREAGLKGAPFGDLPFNTFRRVIVEEMLQTYLSDEGLTWRNTLAVGQGPPNPYGFGASDLAAAMFWQIYKDDGLRGFRRFFTRLEALSQATTPEGAIDNFVRAAYAATGKDYRYLFKDESLKLQ